MLLKLGFIFIFLSWLVVLIFYKQKDPALTWFLLLIILGFGCILYDQYNFGMYQMVAINALNFVFPLLILFKISRSTGRQKSSPGSVRQSRTSSSSKKSAKKTTRQNRRK